MADELTSENITPPLGLPELPDDAPIDTLLVVSAGLLYRATVGHLLTGGGSNQSDLAVILAPIDAGTVGVAMTFSATANTSAVGATIAKVEFLLGPTRVATATAAPYVVEYIPTAADIGKKLVTARVTDSQGRSAVSEARYVTISSGFEVVNQAPKVSMKLSTDSGVVGQPLGIIGSANDEDGTVAKLEFYNYGTKIGEATETPYTLEYTPTDTKLLVLSVKAYDNLGASAQTVGKSVVVVKAGVVATVPNAPYNAAATAGNNKATLTASVPTSDGGSAITGYNWYRVGTTQAIATGVGLNYTDNSVLNGTAYTWQVSAVNSVGEGPKSSPTNSATPAAPAQPTVPAAPYNLVAVGGNATVTITAQPPTNDGGSAITGYNWYRNGNSTAIATGVGRVFTDNTATNGTSYYYEAEAVNAVGKSVKSAPSNEVVPTAPALPTFDTTLTGPSEAEATGTQLTAEAGDLFKFNARPIGASDARSMNLLLPGGSDAIALVDFLSPYDGALFSFVLASSGAVYYGNFADGNVTLRTNP